MVCSRSNRRTYPRQAWSRSTLSGPAHHSHSTLGGRVRAGTRSTAPIGTRRGSTGSRGAGRGRREGTWPSLRLGTDRPTPPGAPGGALPVDLSAQGLDPNDLADLGEVEHRRLGLQPRYEQG